MTRLKSHQVGIDNLEELDQQEDSALQDKAVQMSGESQKLSVRVEKKNSNDHVSSSGGEHTRRGKNKLHKGHYHHHHDLYLQTSSSVSDDETLAEFANSRTIIKL